MTIVINRVFTRIGDGGTTRLASGEERRKSDVRVEAYGTVDELASVLGLVVAELGEARELPSDRADREHTLSEQIRRIQNELFDLGGELATSTEEMRSDRPGISADAILRLESEIEATNEHLPALRSFVLAGGGRLSAELHHARTVCRRAERRIVALGEREPLRQEIVPYVNRLGDWLFVMARDAAVGRGFAEELWGHG